MEGKLKLERISTSSRKYKVGGENLKTGNDHHDHEVVIPNMDKGQKIKSNGDEDDLVLQNYKDFL